MSEFLAEARILVRPDTSRFRKDLEAQLQSVVARPVKIPVVPVVAPAAFAGAIAGSSAFAAAQQNLAASTAISSDALATATTIERQYAGAVDLSTVATNALTAAQTKGAVVATESAAAQAANSRALSQGARGIAASGLSLFGLRGATLAASGAFLAGTAAVVGFSKAIKSAASLETELNVFRVTAGATADQMDRVSAAAKQLGRDITLPGVTAGAAATAMTELAKAGLSVEDSLAGARGALQLSTAAQIDVADATNLVAGSLNAFGLAGTDAVKVADLLTGAAKSSQGEITDMGTALAQAAAVSHQFGVSIEDTITLLTELAQAGIEGGRAGTSLRVAFLRLVNPPADAAKALEKLNVQIRDAQGNLRPQIFTDIARALQGYTKAQRDATLATIFGADAIRTAGIIGNKGAAAFEATRDAVTQAGLAQELAGARTQGFEGDVENLSNQIETLGLSIGAVAKGPVGALVRALGAATGAINETVDAADKKGVFETIGNEIANFASSAERLGLGFNRAVIASTQASNEFTVFDQVAKGVTETVNGLADALKNASHGLAVQLPKDAGLGVKQIQNVITGFDAKGVRDKIRGDNDALLADLNSEQDFLEAQLQRDFVKRRPALQRLIEQNLLGVVTEIGTIQKKAQSAAATVKADAKRAADDAAQAVRDNEQNLLAQFGLARDQRQNRIAQAGLTAGLGDDLTQQKLFKALVLKQIAAIKENISVAGGKAAAISALRAILTQIDGQTASLLKQQKEARDQRRQDLISGIGLDVSLDQITGNQQKEIADRKRLIAQLKVSLALEKKGTLAYKEIRNQIAEQNAAIDEITAAKKQQVNSFAQASFDFLQAQQGFASNLLGNLIPSGATSGLVGGSVSQALTPVAGVVEGKSQSGPTAGQAQTTNGLLVGILAQLKHLNGTDAAPEANRQRRQSGSIMDGSGTSG